MKKLMTACAALALLAAPLPAYADWAIHPYKVKSIDSNNIVLCADDGDCKQVMPITDESKRAARCSKESLLEATYMLETETKYPIDQIGGVDDLAATIGDKKDVFIAWATCHAEGSTYGMVVSNLCVIVRDNPDVYEDQNFDKCAAVMLPYDSFYNNEYTDG